jgi:hypothetical protein
LRREPDLNGFLHFREMLETGMARLSVADTLRNSAEARRTGVALSAAPEALAPLPPPSPGGPTEIGDLLDVADPHQFIVAAYRRILDREPDPAGLAHHLQLVWQGYPRQFLLHQLAASREAAEFRKTFTLRGRRLEGAPPLAVRARAGWRKLRPHAQAAPALVAEALISHVDAALDEIRNRQNVFAQTMDLRLQSIESRQSAFEKLLAETGRRLQDVRANQFTVEQARILDEHVTALTAEGAARQAEIREQILLLRAAFAGALAATESDLIARLDQIAGALVPPAPEHHSNHVPEPDQ